MEAIHRQMLNPVLSAASRVGGSFRDPEGRVYTASGHTFRGVSAGASDRLRDFLKSEFFKKRAGNSIVNTWEISPDQVIDSGVAASEVTNWNMWVEHETIPLVTFPYEWSFVSLQRAACLTLDLLADSVRNGYMLKDASAFNVQFIDQQPIFIDILSFIRYEQGVPFLGYKQFCEQFFAPLCLTAFAGIEFNSWFRGRLDGLDLKEVSQALPISTRLRLQVALHIHYHAHAMRKLESKLENSDHDQHKRQIPQHHLIAMVTSLRKFISKLERNHTTYWQMYSKNTSYLDQSREAKISITQEFVTRIKPSRILDLGCNTGDFSEIAVNAGANSVVGVDSDCGALDLAAERGKHNSSSTQFLFFDIANPSPNIGWLHQERVSLEERIGKVDAVLCFALIHHIVIGRNIPLEEFVSWVCSFAPAGLIEFVPKSDSMTKQLLRTREDVFEDYCQSNFELVLKRQASDFEIHRLDQSDRIVFEFYK